MTGNNPSSKESGQSASTFDVGDRLRGNVIGDPIAVILPLEHADGPELPSAVPHAYPGYKNPSKNLRSRLGEIYESVVSDPKTETELDSRFCVPFDQYKQAPWRGICLIYCTYQRSRDRFRGSGFLTKDGVVVTAGHVLVDPDYGSAVSITVWPGYHEHRGETCPEFQVEPPNWRVCPKWKSDPQVENDYGIIRLPNISDPSRFGAVSMWILDDGSWNDLVGMDQRRTPVCVTGYPGDKKSPTAQWQGNGRVVKHWPGIVHHLCDTKKGQSGAPMLLVSNGASRAIAVHCQGEGTRYNVARKLDRRFLEDYDRLRGEFS